MADTWITDTGASTRFPVYTRANASDVLPGPVSPLGATLSWIPGLMEGWRDGNIRQGAFSVEEVAGDPNPVCAIFNGYFYVNASVVRVYGERAGAGAAAIDAAFFGNRPDTPPYVPHPDDQSEAAAERIGSTMAWVMSATEWPEMEESKRRADAARAERPDLAAASDAELVARAREMTQLEREFFSDHVLSSSNTAVGPTIVGQIAPAQHAPAARIGRRRRLRPPVLRAVAPVPRGAGVAGADRGVRGRRRRAPGAPAGRGRRRRRRPSSTTSTASSRTSAPAARTSGTPTRTSGRAGPSWCWRWSTACGWPATTQSPVARHDAVAADRDAATAEVLAGLGDDEATKGLLLAGQASALRFMGWRERTKTNCVKAVHEQRMALRELGRRAAERGALDHPKQVFMLLADELDDFVADPAAFRDRCREREAAWRLLWDREPPYFIEGDKGVPPLSSLLGKGDEAVTMAASGDVLTGGPGCAGVVQGTARVILDPSDPTALEPGDILIAPNTDPAWTPLFVPAGGVVVDVGALNSHAVIVSRELGIPCVVSVVDATKRIPDGALIEIDGGAGTVKIL